MRRDKILILVSEAQSNWGSCRTISSNLIESYRRLEGQFDLQWLEMPKNLHENYGKNYHQVTSLHGLYRAIREARPDRIVFVDHAPHSGDILTALNAVGDGAIAAPLIIHLYGDFTWLAEKWIKLARAFPDHPLQIVCASEKQTEFVKGCLAEGSPPDAVHTVPFSLDPKAFYFDSGLREKTRAAWGIGSDEKIVLYTGRLSLQKNITRLIREFARIVEEGLEKSDDKSRLYFAGNFDDIGSGPLGITTSSGYYYGRVQGLIASLPPTVASRIRFLGMLDPAELHAAYCGADVFASLSLYHDEDFGMSVAEALACGLPCVISDWAGYTSFARPGLPCQLVPVTLHKDGVLLSSSVFRRELRSALARSASNEDRASVGERFLTHFSIEGVARQLEALLRRNVDRFAGFNWKLETLLTVDREPPNVAMQPIKNSFYEQLYAPYFTDPDSARSVEWEPKHDLIHWAREYRELGPARATTKGKPEIQELKYCLSPFAIGYTSPAQPVFLFDGWDRDLVTKKPRWHARDGILPLYWFFRQSAPERFPARLLVHEELHFLVPSSWKEHVDFYRVRSSVPHFDFDQAKGLLLCGLMSPAFASPPELERHLERIVSIVGSERLARMRIQVFMPYRDSGRDSSVFWDSVHEQLYLDTPVTLLRKMGLHVQPIAWNQIEFRKSFEGDLYYELNHGWVIKDTSVRHHVLAKGAVALESLHNSEAIARSQDEVIPLSPFHELVVSKSGASAPFMLPEEKTVLEYAAIGNSLFSHKRFNHPWPEWFESLCKSSLGRDITDFEPRTDRNP
ncbi:MAG: glycosyltransferase family 4 protein [Oligoflexia bacterium]|nr:glycosyltransferase family 4 protein [Oligoflexia bacterium]